MDSVNYSSRIVLLLAALLTTALVQADEAGPIPALNIAGVSEENINGMLFISPVTEANYAQVMQRLRERMALRQLSATETDRLLSDVSAGTYFYAYGFQLAKNWNQPAAFLVSATLGSPWYQYELHKHSDGSVRLLGMTTSVDAEKFEFYSKTYGPTPKLLTRPEGNYNILLVLPYSNLGKIIYQELPMGQRDVSTIDAAIFPIKD